MKTVKAGFSVELRPVIGREGYIGVSFAYHGAPLITPNAIDGNTTVSEVSQEQYDYNSESILLEKGDTQCFDLFT
ncbi:hypothetical protein EA007_06535 [Vibrio anguillarum]|uniref:hypothetical protein n=2 Tax=Vibrio anguillarum TaxID=55601 RepID=UPI00188B5535|nr:hypothetical protein [Vibrio anguillarum]MBF4250650.1 hypothetical protein [Vibrio anguillarum]